MVYVYRHHWKSSVEILIVMTSGEANWDLRVQIRAGKRDFVSLYLTISSPPHPVLVPALSIYCFSTIKNGKNKQQKNLQLFSKYFLEQLVH